MYTAKEVINFAQVNDVKFIRLSFCDLFGNHKNIAIMPDELERAFTSGIPFDASSVQGFTNANRSDLFLFPDPPTMRVLPWRPQRGRVIRLYCDIRYPDGTPYIGDTRRLLKEALRRAELMGYHCRTGAECEFYLFKTDDNGFPTKMAYDTGEYFDIAPLDKGENVRREICLTLEEMGIKPRASLHAQGPGQNEIDFTYDDILPTADNFMTLKAVVKAIAAKNGLFASFMPKPIPDKSGNGLHVNLSLIKDGENIFSQAPKHSLEAESFIAGVLERVPEITAFLNPLTNSYARVGCFGAPRYVSWSHQNRSQLIRIPAADVEDNRMELRSPDPAINPYLAWALLLNAGLDGVEKGLILPPALDIDLYTADAAIIKQLTMLPQSLTEALLQAEQSEFVQHFMGEELLNKYIALKAAEAAEYDQTADKAVYDHEKYFNRV
jgi:glutamine synthetase